MGQYFKYIYLKKIKWDLLVIIVATVIAIISIKNIKLKSPEIKGVMVLGIGLIFIIVNIYLSFLFMKSKELKFMYINGFENRDIIKILKLKVISIDIGLLVIIAPIIIWEKGIIELIIVVVLSDIINNVITLIINSLTKKYLIRYLIYSIIFIGAIYVIFNNKYINNIEIFFIMIVSDVVIYWIMSKRKITYKKEHTKASLKRKRLNINYESKRKAFIRKDILLIFRNIPILIVYILINILNLAILICIKNKDAIIFIGVFENILLISLILDLYKLEIEKERFLKILPVKKKELFINKMLLAFILAYLPSVFLLCGNVLLGRVSILDFIVYMLIYAIIDGMLSYVFGSIIIYCMPNLNAVNFILAMIVVIFPLIPIVFIVTALLNLKKLKEG